MKTSLPNHTLVDYCCVEKLAIAEGMKSFSYRVHVKLRWTGLVPKSHSGFIHSHFLTKFDDEYVTKENHLALYDIWISINYFPLANDHTS